MSDEAGKGISLRRKKTTRPTISAPRQINTTPKAPLRDRSADSRNNGSLWETQTNNSTSNSIAPGRDVRPGTGGENKTSDLVKRRYSTRFAGGVPLQDGLAPPVPAIPSLPAQYARNPSKSPSRDGRSVSREDGRLRADVHALKDPNLAVDKYVQSILADATEDDILGYQNELLNLKGTTSADLQHNVYQNRTQFIKISKEADRLKSEMRTLRTLMSDLTGALGHATSAGTSILETAALLNGTNGRLSTADRKRANRSSVANLEAMWSTHLQTLWKRIEGSQKYLPALPGRHIIMESQRWVELNAATWKPRRRVCLVLLNDHLLVASEKKRRPEDATPESAARSKRQSVYNAASQTTLVAERCWALQDVSLADISSSSSSRATPDRKNIANAVNLRAGNESFTYATSDAAEKGDLLVAFRKAHEDLRKQTALEHGERERQLDELAMLTGRDPRILKKAVAQQDEDGSKSGLARSNSVLLDVDGRQQSIRWVESQIDALDIDIALQRREEAVARIEKLRALARGIRGNATARDVILAKIDARSAKLAAGIARQLALRSAQANRTREHVGWLLRLGCEELARTRYLAARTETVRCRTRAIPFTGALVPYVHALAFATFGLVLQTLRTFAQAFPAAAGSAGVKWAKERTEEFREVLGRQLGGVQSGSEVWRECLAVVKEQVGVLGEVGVDFMGLVMKGLEPEGGVNGTGRREGSVGVRP